jgi:Tfp pilus assembly pilus retraction ATPase PilT
VKSFDTKAIAPQLQDHWNQKGSDQRLAGALAPQLCLAGDLRPAEDEWDLSGEQSRSLIEKQLPPVQLTIIERRRDFDPFFSCQDRVQLPSSAFTLMGKPAPAQRMVSSNAPSFAQLGHSPADKW